MFMQIRILFFFFYGVEKHFFFKRLRWKVLFLKVPMKCFTTASQFDIAHKRRRLENKGDFSRVSSVKESVAMLCSNICINSLEYTLNPIVLEQAF